ncbi:SDR family NAD(P)-dependent oxidoreductase [Sabulicella rubraurantiaca]|uniref:SDR family NAD(P)-dependent oxidoreductase n=1 Tax=Sabulicella rubraurantiaca TaxID=2811429 RepID=UPI001A95D2DA|nr:SDR family oxidoreductase [Sabulicella rubraurantiaca]
MTSTLAITGAASGLGAALAARARDAGWTVAGADRTPGAGITALDVTDEAAVEAWITGLGDLRGLVTCAGISAHTPMPEADAATFRRVLEVNVTGTFLASRAAARVMAPGSAMVLISSVSGLRGSVGRVAYGASKAAVVNMAQVMAIDLAPRGIRVNCICPGPIETPMVRELHDPATRSGWTSRIPLGRYGTPEEVADAALFLLDGERAAYVNGHALAVDGGYAGAGLMT